MSHATEISENPTEAGPIADQYPLGPPPWWEQPDSPSCSIAVPSISEVTTSLSIFLAPTPIPPLVLQTMRESVCRSNDEKKARDIVLDIITSTEFLSPDQIAFMSSEFIHADGEVCLDHDIFRKEANTTGVEPEICTMAKWLLRKSQRVREIPANKQRCLVKSLSETSSESDVMDFLLHRLPLELSLNAHDKALIMNDVLDNRYYRLILPDRLDCLKLQPDDDRCSLCRRGDLHSDWGTFELKCCLRNLCSVCMNNARAHSKCPHCSVLLDDKSERSHL